MSKIINKHGCTGNGCSTPLLSYFKECNVNIAAKFREFPFADTYKGDAYCASNNSIGLNSDGTFSKKLDFLIPA